MRAWIRSSGELCTSRVARWIMRNDSWSLIFIRLSSTVACLVSLPPRSTRNGNTATLVSWPMTLHPRGPSLPHGQPFLSKLAGASGKVPTCTSWSSVVRARNRPARLFIHTCSNNARHTNLNSLEIYPIEAELGLSLWNRRVMFVVGTSVALD